MGRYLTGILSPFAPGGTLNATLVSLDEASAAPFSEADVEEVWETVHGNQFDGRAVVILRLADGRFAGFVTDYSNVRGNAFDRGEGKMLVATTKARIVQALS